MDEDFVLFLQQHGFQSEEYAQLLPTARIPLITAFYQYKALRECTCGKRNAVPAERIDTIFNPRISSALEIRSLSPGQTSIPGAADDNLSRTPSAESGEESKTISADELASLPRVLVVDDSLPSRKYLSALLVSAGFVCDSVEDGSIAVNQVYGDVTKYGLVFMDRLMPRMNGLEATTKLRDLGFTGLIFGLTGLKFDEQVMEVLESGADAMFSKPFTKAQMKALVHHIVARGNVSNPDIKWTYDRIATEFVEDSTWR